MKKISSTIHNLFLQERTILFCGSGVSYNSGIPIVQPLTTFILEKFEAQKEHIESYIKSGFPFEGTIQNIIQRVLNGSFLEIFDVKSPSMSHEYIAWLAFNNKLKIIITTNFDENIEIALKGLGWTQGKEFEVVSDLEKFDITLFNEKVVVVKLHGTVKNIESLITTINTVANKQNYDLIKNVLNQIYSLDTFENVLYWGYSFSDHFDISRVLTEMKPLSKKAYVIQHDSAISKEEEYLINKGPLNAFLKTTGLKCNSDVVLNELFEIIKKPTIRFNKAEWKEVMAKWIQNIFDGKGLRNKYAMLAHLFIEAGHLEIGVYYAKQGLEKGGNSDPVLKMDLLSKIGNSLLVDVLKRDVKKAIPYFEEAISIAKSIGHTDSQLIYSGNLGSCYLEMGDIINAEKSFKDAINSNTELLVHTKEQGKVLEDICGYETMLAICYRRQGKLTEAEELLRKTLKTCEDHGIMRVKELCLSGLGRVYSTRGDYQTHLDYHVKAYELAKQMVLLHRLDILFINICTSLKKVRGNDSAKEYYLSEIHFLQKTTKFNLSFERVINLLEDYAIK